MRNYEKNLIIRFITYKINIEQLHTKLIVDLS